MALEPITTTGPTITVSTPEDLKEAYTLLSNQEGGGTIEMAGGEYGTLWIYHFNIQDGDQPVVIKSADSSDPAMFDRIHIRDASNIRIENIVMDSTGEERSESIVDLFIQDSDNIQIIDSVFQHDTDNALKDAGEIVERMGQVRSSDNILIEGNLIDGYFHGLAVTDSNNVEILSNEITNIQGDGIRGGGFQDSVIADNYMHDFYGVDWKVTHSDMIQIWGTNNSQITSNLTISGNTLISSDQVSQTIFIRNGDFGKDGSDASGYFQDITITDNLIYNAHYHGITVEDADGVLIDNNTVLWNPDATLDKGTELGKYYEPVISLKNTLDATVTDNIAADVAAPDNTFEDGNVIVTYGDPDDPNYVGNHFVNPMVGADVTVADINMLSDSPWYGVVGSSIGSASPGGGDTNSGGGDNTGGGGDTGDTGGGGDDTGDTGDTGGGDGGDDDTQPRTTDDIFAFDFEDGVVDISEGTPDVVYSGTTIEHDGDRAFLVGDGSKLQIDDGTEGLHGIDSFGLALDLTLTGDETFGTFLHLHQTMSAGVTEEGYVVFELVTDEGSFELISRDPIFEDGDTHRIGFAFDGDNGQLEIFADGESVSTTEAWGTTLSNSYYLTFGNSWQDSMDAIIDNVEMSGDPSVAGLFSEDPPVEEPPVEEPPEEPSVEEPPVEEPPVEEPPEEPPVEEPPEEPPVEDPPEEPPVEEPPVEEPEDPGDRGDPRSPVESSGNDNFLSQLLDIFLSIFGLGSDNDKPPATEETAAASFETSLEDVVPVIEVAEEDTPDADEEEEDIFDFAA